MIYVYVLKDNRHAETHHIIDFEQYDAWINCLINSISIDEESLLDELQYGKQPPYEQNYMIEVDKDSKAYSLLRSILLKPIVGDKIEEYIK